MKLTGLLRHPSRAAMVDIVERLERARRFTSARRSLLVALTGIDACGKGYLTGQIGRVLEARSYRVAIVNIDAWLNLPRVRFSETNPAEHFYLNALRLDDMFAALVRPLRDNRSVRVTADTVEETDTQYRRRVYDYADVDVILLEGIYLLKREYQAEYDLTIWVDCSFETALERAIRRAQEGLGAVETIAAYRRIYFPAQLIHDERDRPREAASYIVPNDVSSKLPTDARIVAPI